MKLNDAVTASVMESNLFTINEEDEGPRWQFNYNGKKVTDFNPDILLLGAYKHPTTGNNLIGGINLNYISPKQRDQIAYALPQIINAENLLERYWIGRSLLPEIFKNYYRTYNPKYIRGVKKDVMYPKYGYLKSAQNWAKKKIGSIFKSKEQRSKELEPKYREDLAAMSDKLDQVVSQLSQDQETNTPEVQAAMRAAKDFQRQKSVREIGRQEIEPLRTARRDLEAAQQEPGMQPPEEYENSEVGAGMLPKKLESRPRRRPAIRPLKRQKEPTEPTGGLPAVSPPRMEKPGDTEQPTLRPSPSEPRNRRPIGRSTPEDAINRPRRPIGRPSPEDTTERPKRPIGRPSPEDTIEKPKRPIGRSSPDTIKKRPTKRQTPPAVDNEIDPDIDLQESIIYYSPVAGHYIIEHFELS
jgi:hypothetical protein